MSFDLTQEAKNLIAIRSDADHGTRNVVLTLFPFCKSLGFQITLQTPANGGSGNDLNLIAHTAPRNSRDLCPNGLLLVTHLDTVPAGDPSQWTETGGNPFQATVKGDRIYGLGSADTKLDFLCKLQAIETVGLKNLKIPFALVGTFGEERALTGTRLLRDSGLVHPGFVLVGEPSELMPVVAHKGILYMRGMFPPSHPPPHPAFGHPLPREERIIRKEIFRGRAAHGSMPHLGENAITKAIEWLIAQQKKNPALHLVRIEGGTAHNIVPELCEIEIQEMENPDVCSRISFLKKFYDLIAAAESLLKTEENRAFDPSRTTWNVGVIRGDEEKIEIEFDFRLIPETDGNELFTIFQSLSQEIPGARVEVIRSNPPMNTDPGSEIARRVGEALKEVGLTPRFLAKSGNTEGAIFNAMGAESIVIGPGRSVGNIHAPNEYNEISQLEKAVAFYTAFLKKYV